MKKTYAFLIALVVLSLLPITNALASNITLSAYTSGDVSTIDYDYDYDSDLLTISVFEIFTPYTIERIAGYQYKSATHSKYFYIISTGEKVAEYSLTANFRYDTDAELAECRSTSTTGNSEKTGWSITRTSDIDNVNPALGAGRGDFTLFYNSEVNNTDTIIIYCDHEGTITKS